jgi:MFS family permease
MQDRSYLIVWTAGMLISTVRWLELLVIGVFVFDLTHSPFQVALMLILRMLPLALFGAISAGVADKIGQRYLLLLSLAVMVVVSIVTAVLVTLSLIEMWHLALASFVGGVFWCTDYPTRRMLLGDIAGTERIGTAMSLDAITNNGTRMLGPLLGGSLLAVLGLDGAFYLGAVLYLIAIGAIAKLPVDVGAASDNRDSVITNVLEGLRYLKKDTNLTSLLAVTVIFNLWGFPFLSMIPVIGRDVHDLGSFAVGVLASCEGVGALVGALLIATFATARHFRRLYLGGLAIYLVLIVVFAQAPTPYIAAGAMLVVGLGGAAFSAMQSTLIYLNAPPAMRSRMMGVLSVCIGTGPIGFAHVGLLATYLDAPTAVAIIGIEGAIALVLVCVAWPRLLSKVAT